ncbi:hypothetical protein GGTG_00735 [Gaeumannomyces tritici R3-111a-1]|uniref:Uncharacterized protein n=1 Tax=Gaeumannomyces tritici (strain R3-111a-1) TaxID=644352 RepID=J3NHJ8_GAET3|nr:hypothetical protein GGTG_00735 [Gaeumannomyces tritici R3-111a-1]EJT80741.1 hypothetical protein GGTG_00735 [Gaeumannomyces tritici R3-111a-1]
MAPTVVLITGANRGLGAGLTKRFLAEPPHLRAKPYRWDRRAACARKTVDHAVTTGQIFIAAVRDPSHPTVANLSAAPKGQGTKLVVVKYDAAVEQSPFDVVASLKGRP